MPRQPSTTGISTTTTIALFLILFLALFPDLFHLIWTFPFTLVSRALHSSKPDPATLQPAAAMSWTQKQFTLQPKSRGSYLITDQVTAAVPEIRNYKVGLLNLFVQHTSCALSLNENWDEDVREDMSDALDRIAPAEGPKGQALYRHDAEGPDDMPAHIKSALIGASVTIPIKDGKLATGTWQGIWYLEFRASRHQRRVVATIQGEKM
ncbi:Carboxypeptidase [Purpureocillium lavendulum]|uniref:Carboxypeptidase n=1 Tax=Purpureocillium lavendulum TaxID=1247861 RepID=A0AB34G5Z0_9HYPO|nr:Carboxypeptidase [Purpureocillium lavendulum]